MKKWKVMLKKGFAFALAAAVAGSSTGVSAAEKTKYVFSGTVDLGELRMFDDSETVSDESDSELKITNKNEEKWFDRVAFSDAAAALALYQALEEGADNNGKDDILISPEVDSDGEALLKAVTITQDTEITKKQKNSVYSWIYAVTEAFDRDHPEVFWLNGDKKAEYKGVWTSTSGYTYTFYLVLQTKDYDIRSSAYSTEDKIKEEIKNRNDYVSNICSGIPEGDDKDDEDVITYFHQWLTEHNEYNTNTDLNDADSSCWECISALKGSDGTSGPVCEGYARAFKVLCDSVEIPCVLVDGMASATGSEEDGGAHMWNYVQLGGSWYGVDVTWDDPKFIKNGEAAGGQISGGESTEYFLVGSKTLNSHKVEFLTSHPVSNQASKDGLKFTNGPELSTSAYGEMQIQELPVLKGTYGTTAGALTLTGGIVMKKQEAVKGTWSVSEDDADTQYPVHTSDKVKVIFTPDDTPQNTLTAEVQPEIEAKSLPSDLTVTLENSSYAYDGEEKKPAVTAVKDGEKKLTEGTDYVVSYEDNIAAGDHTAKVKITGKGNYSGTAEKTFSIAKAAYTDGSISRSYSYETGSNGQVSLNLKDEKLIPDDAGNVAYSITDYSKETILKETPAVGQKDGVLTFEVNSGSKDAKASITVKAETDNYKDITITLNISLKDKKKVELQAESEISFTGGTLTYGDTLSKLTLNTAAFVEQGTDQKVEGKLTWENAAQILEAGDHDVSWVFTPEETTVYQEVTGKITVHVLKAEPNLEAPTAAAITYDPAKTLADISLNGKDGSWLVGTENKTVRGTWNWKEADTVPTAGSSGYTAVFTPDDENYSSVEKTVTLSVTKAAPVITTVPTASAITYGEALAASELTQGAASFGAAAVSGKFEWKEKAAKPVSGNTTSYPVIFIPEDSNYDTAECSLALTVKKAETAPGMPKNTMNVENGCEKVGNVTLAQGWDWAESDREKALLTEKEVTASAIYTGEDKGNYEQESVLVTIIRQKAEEKNPSGSTAAGTTGSSGGSTTAAGTIGSSGGSTAAAGTIGSSGGSTTAAGTTGSSGGNTAAAGTTDSSTAAGTTDNTDSTPDESKTEEKETNTDADSEAVSAPNNDSSEKKEPSSSNAADTAQTGNNNTADNTSKKDTSKTEDSTASQSKTSNYKTVSLKEQETAALKIDKNDSIKLHVKQNTVTSVKYKVINKGSNKGSVVLKLYKKKKQTCKVRVKIVNNKVKVTILKGKGLKVKQSGKKTVIKKNGKTLFTVKKK